MKSQRHHPTRRDVLSRTAKAVAAGSALTWPHARFSRAAAVENTPAIGLGLLGTAHIHLNQYAQLIEQTGGAVVRAVYDDPGSRGAERLDVPAADSLDALLSREDIDAVVILSENMKHENYVTAAATAGKAIFVEKPLEITRNRAARAAEAVEQAGVIFQTGYFMRSLGHFRFLRQAIREGKFGNISRMRLQYAHAGSLIGWWDGDHAWMAQLDKVGRGALGDLGIHALNLLRWITEGDPLRAVAAHLGSATGKYEDLDEFGEAMFRFESGLVATLGAGYVDQSDANQFELSGTEGHAIINRGRLFLRCSNITGDDRQRHWANFDPSLPHPLALFLQAVRGDTDVPLIPVREAARDVAVMDSVYHAARTGEWIRL